MKHLLPIFESYPQNSVKKPLLSKQLLSPTTKKKKSFMSLMKTALLLFLTFEKMYYHKLKSSMCFLKNTDQKSNKILYTLIYVSMKEFCFVEEKVNTNVNSISNQFMNKKIPIKIGIFLY
jgi:hypothetical protein